MCKKGRSYRISMYLVYLFYLLAHCECLVSNLHLDDSKEEVRLHTNGRIDQCWYRQVPKDQAV